MIIVAGPPGGGKSSLFPVRELGVEWFNADDSAAALNRNSYWRISTEIRAAASRQLQQFIDGNTEARQSFAYESTLRSEICFDQIRRAKELGFFVRMSYIAAGPVDEHIRRVMNRARLGGHSASERRLRDIYERSMKNLVVAFELNRQREIDRLRVFDNSAHFGSPRLVLGMARGVPVRIAATLPEWLETALAGSPFAVERLRAMARRNPA